MASAVSGPRPGQLEHRLDQVRLGHRRLDVGQRARGRRAPARGEGAVLDGGVELDHAVGQDVQALVVLQERQAITRLRREQAALVLDLVDAQAEQRRDLCQLLVDLGQAALRAFLDALARVPGRADPASRSHYDHAQGDRYALFHRSAFMSLIVESCPCAAADEPPRGEDSAKSLIHEGARTRGEYTEAACPARARAVTEDFKMKAGAGAPAILSTK